MVYNVAANAWVAVAFSVHRTESTSVLAYRCAGILQAPKVPAAEAVTVAALVHHAGAAAPTVLTYGGLLQYLSCPTTSAGPCDSNGACVEARDTPNLS